MPFVIKNLKVGDWVRLRKGLKVGGVYGDMRLFDTMVFEGAREITNVNSYGTTTINGWNYPYEMLAREKKPKEESTGGDLMAYGLQED